MAEPLSIVAGSLSVAVTAFKAGKQTYDLTLGIKDAPKHIERLVKNFGMLYGVMGTLQMLLDSDKIKSGDPIPNLMTQNIETALAGCIQLFKDIQQIVSPFIAANGKAFQSTWKAIKWDLFKRHDVGVLEEALNFNKQILSIACSALTLSVLPSLYVHHAEKAFLYRDL